MYGWNKYFGCTQYSKLLCFQMDFSMLTLMYLMLYGFSQLKQWSKLIQGLSGRDANLPQLIGQLEYVKFRESIG